MNTQTLQQLNDFVAYTKLMEVKYQLTFDQALEAYKLIAGNQTDPNTSTDTNELWIQLLDAAYEQAVSVQTLRKCVTEVLRGRTLTLHYYSEILDWIKQVESLEEGF